MIKHIVCFKLKKGESIDEAEKVLISMKSNVPEIIDIEVGKDFLKSVRSFDIALIVTLKDKKALDDYQSDAYHVSVVKKHMHAVVEKSIAIDYEI